MLLSFVVLLQICFCIFSASAQKTVVKYLYFRSGCGAVLNQEPYQIEIDYGNVCVFSRKNPSSTEVTPVIYTNIFPNGTLQYIGYASVTLPATPACSGPSSAGTTAVTLTACAPTRDIATNTSYYYEQEVVVNPSLATLTANRPYSLIK